MERSLDNNDGEMLDNNGEIQRRQIMRQQTNKGREMSFENVSSQIFSFSTKNITDYLDLSQKFRNYVFNNLN